MSIREDLIELITAVYCKSPSFPRVVDVVDVVLLYLDTREDY